MEDDFEDLLGGAADGDRVKIEPVDADIKMDLTLVPSENELRLGRKVLELERENERLIVCPNMTEADFRPNCANTNLYIHLTLLLYLYQIPLNRLPLRFLRNSSPSSLYSGITFLTLHGKIKLYATPS